MSEKLISLFMILGNWTPSQCTSEEGSFAMPSPVDDSEVVFACPHSYIVGQFIEQPYMKVSKQIRDAALDPSLITSYDISELELKLVALD
jgi:hypothetical protein